MIDKTFEELTIDERVRLLIEKEIIIETPENPGEAVINPDYIDVMEKLLKKEKDLLNDKAKSPEDLLKGLSILAYIIWRGVADETEIILASYYFLEVYEKVKSRNMEEFSASLRLLEKVKTTKLSDLKGDLSK